MERERERERKEEKRKRERRERERLNTTFIKTLTVFLFGFLIQPYNC